MKKNEGPSKIIIIIIIEAMSHYFKQMSINKTIVSECLKFRVPYDKGEQTVLVQGASNKILKIILLYSKHFLIFHILEMIIINSLSLILLNECQQMLVFVVNLLYTMIKVIQFLIYLSYFLRLILFIIHSNMNSISENFSKHIENDRFS